VPVCLNQAAAHSYLLRTFKKTELVLAGRTKAQMIETIKEAVASKELPAMEVGAMCYMLSKHGHLSDRDGHWHPHLMFFYSKTDPASWAAGAQGFAPPGQAKVEIRDVLMERSNFRRTGLTQNS
jgi:hypothetical protein